MHYLLVQLYFNYNSECNSLHKRISAIVFCLFAGIFVPDVIMITTIIVSDAANNSAFNLAVVPVT
jgi:hypothetical protein